MLAQNVGISVQHNAFQERLAQLEDTIALTSAAPPCVLLPVLTPSRDLPLDNPTPVRTVCLKLQVPSFVRVTGVRLQLRQHSGHQEPTKAILLEVLLCKPTVIELIQRKVRASFPPKSKASRGGRSRWGRSVARNVLSWSL